MLVNDRNMISKKNSVFEANKNDQKTNYPPKERNNRYENFIESPEQFFKTISAKDLEL